MSISPATPSLLDDDEKPRRRGRWILAVIVLILLAIVVPPFVSLNRLKGRLGAALTNSLGRQVTIGQIRLRLLPRPGFDLGDVTIQDDPAFSAEPMLHSGAVTASLRFSSLWRGRIEIASLSFQEPSVNFVRNPQGRWNIAALLERAQRIPSAPTGKKVSEARPRFPYVEASDARINFKIGMEKKAYGFSEADLAFWLAAEDEWHVRMEARPIRSDRNLHDTGTVKLEGTFQRAANPRQTPVNLAVSLDNGQLGQLSEFIYGRDRGWRGGLDANATIAGTPSNLQLAFNATLDDFRRYDITGSDSSRIRARCTAQYADGDSESQSLHNIDCRLPSGNGEVSMRGSVEALFRNPQYDLSIAVSHLPGAVLASAVRRMRRGVIADLNAAGEMNGAFTVRSGGGEDATPVFAGGGSLHNVRITSRMIQPEFVLSDVQFALDRDDTKPAKRGRKRGPQDAAIPPTPTLRVSSTELVLGSAPQRVAYLEAAIHPGDFSVSLRGQAALERALPIAQALGFSVPKSAITGVADLNLVMNGVARDFAEPWFEGKASLNAVKIRAGAFPKPITMDYATAEFSRGGTDFWMQEAVIGDGSVRVRGTITFPRECSTDVCPVRFALSSNQLNLDDLNSLFNSAAHDRPWYSFGKRTNADLVSLAGQGSLNLGRLVVKSATFDRFTGFIHFEDGKLDITNITTDVGTGKHLGELHATFTGDSPQYDLAGTITKASLDAVGNSLWSSAWHGSPAHSGTLDAKYRLHLSGADAAALFKSAEGSADLLWASGAFTGHADTGAARTLEVREFKDAVTWHDGTLQIPPADLKTPSGNFEISGTFARSYDLRVQSNKKPMLVAFGTLTPVAPVTAKK
ncbi:MAG: AsmA family protein [Terriglobales bacterium]